MHDEPVLTDCLTGLADGLLRAGQPGAGPSVGGPPAALLDALRDTSVVTPLFVKGACLVALLVVVATGAGLWVRTRPGTRRRPRAALVAAVLGVVASQVVVLGALGTRANANLGFVQTVGDLATVVRGAVTTSQDGPVVVKAPTAQAAPTAPRTAHPSPHPADVFTFKPVTDDPDHVGFYMASAKGRRSGVSQDIWVWAPRGYSPKSSGTFPVMVFLHGDPGTAAATASALKTAEAAQKAIDTGAMPPSLIVFPDLRADDRQAVAPDCANVVGQAKVGTWVQEDVPAIIRAAFPNVSPNRSGWGIGGLSSGAYCSVWTGIMRSEIFGYIISMSGYDAPVVGGMSADETVKKQNTLSTLLATRPHPPLRLWVLAAQDDEGSTDIRINLPAATQPPDTVEVITPEAGGHATSLWRESFPAALAWWGTQLRSPVPSGHESASASPSADPTASATPGSTAESADAQSGAGEQAPRNLGEKILNMFTGIRGAGVIVMAWIAAIALSVAAVVPWRRAGGARARVARPQDEPQAETRPDVEDGQVGGDGGQAGSEDAQAEGDASDTGAQSCGTDPTEVSAAPSGTRHLAEQPAGGDLRGRLAALGDAAVPVLLRTGVLGLACLTGSLAVGLVVNRLGGFYPSWPVAVSEIIYALS